ncbi:MAG: ABC transporter ATP-binding protein [Christensenellales bacterium]|jgi:ATP-binding cassette subfamily B protein
MAEMYNEDTFVNEKVDLSIWKKLFQYAIRYKKHLILLITTMMLSGCVDVLLPMMNSYAIDNFILPGSVKGLWIFVILYGALQAASAFSVYGFCNQAGQLEAKISYHIRKDAFRKLQELPFSYYDRTPVGYIMARMTSDASRLAETISWSMVDVVWGIVFMVVALVGMFIMEWRLALIMLAVLPPIAVLSVYFQRKILLAYRQVRANNSKITGAFNEGIMGARTTKTLVREDENFKEFQALTGAMKKSSVRAAVFSSLYWPLVSTLGSIATAGVLWLGGVEVQNMALTLGQLSFFVTLSGFFFEPVMNFARLFSDLQSSQAAAERVIKLVETEPEIKDRPEVIEKYGDAFYPHRENWEPLHGQVDFDNVSFTYGGGEEVLQDFNLHVEVGDTIALVGETGSGKSTIVNLICRFYEPTEGIIRIDGKDYRDRSQLWLHSNLGYVLQSPHLFSGTIRENIRYGKLDATDAEVEEAARLVGAEAFINALEKGYETSVGEGGGRLSTGEKQLISFARAILARPAIFVLDEATSSVDTETELHIQKAIETILEGRTSFIVAHRLSTIRNADRILVIDKGRVIEDGSHRELMRRKGHYYNLYTNQFRDEKSSEILGIPLPAAE